MQGRKEINKVLEVQEVRAALQEVAGLTRVRCRRRGWRCCGGGKSHPRAPPANYRFG